MDVGGSLEMTLEAKFILSKSCNKNVIIMGILKLEITITFTVIYCISVMLVPPFAGSKIT